MLFRSHGEKGSGAAGSGCPISPSCSWVEGGVCLHRSVETGTKGNTAGLSGKREGEGIKINAHTNSNAFSDLRKAPLSSKLSITSIPAVTSENSSMVIECLHFHYMTFTEH